MKKFKNISGLILAGGLSKRMNYVPKALLSLNNKPLIEHLSIQLKAQLDEVIISANDNIDIFKKYSSNVQQDIIKGFLGPSIGILSALKIMNNEFLLVVPSDTPNLPENYVYKMRSAMQNNNFKIIVAHNGTFKQPTYCMIHVSMISSLDKFIQSGNLKLGQWQTENNAYYEKFINSENQFININNNNDIIEYNKVISQQHNQKSHRKIGLLSIPAS